MVSGLRVLDITRRGIRDLAKMVPGAALPKPSDPEASDIRIRFGFRV